MAGQNNVQNPFRMIITKSISSGALSSLLSNSSVPPVKWLLLIALIKRNLWTHVFALPATTPEITGRFQMGKVHHWYNLNSWVLVLQVIVFCTSSRRKQLCLHCGKEGAYSCLHYISLAPRAVFFLEGASWNYTEQQGLDVTSNSEDDEGPGFWVCSSASFFWAVQPFPEVVVLQHCSMSNQPELGAAWTGSTQNNYVCIHLTATVRMFQLRCVGQKPWLWKSPNNL